MGNAVVNADTFRNLIYDFLSVQCEVEKSKLNDDLNIESDLGGDSLMFLELIEELRKKIEIKVELQSIGQYLLVHAPKTIGDAVKLSMLIYEHGNKIVDFI